MFYPREARRDKLTQRLVYMIFVIFAGTVFVIMARNDGLPYGSFLIQKENSVGKVTKIIDNGGNYILTYNFTDQSNGHHVKTIFINANLPFVYSTGAEIDITYFPYNPDISYVSSLVPFLMTSLWIMAIGALLTLLAIVISVVTVLGLLKHRREDFNY